MKKFSKNNIPDFINLIQFIRQEFNESYFVVDSPKKEKLVQNFYFEQVTTTVIINESEVTSQNFVLLNSCFPDFFGLVSLSCINKEIALPQLLCYISDLKWDNRFKKIPKKLLEINFHRFFEKMFFADLFTHVWNGEYLAKRVFIFKYQKELYSFGLFHGYDFTKILYEHASVKSKVVREAKERIVFNLTFKIDYKTAVCKITNKLKDGELR